MMTMRERSEVLEEVGGMVEEVRGMAGEMEGRITGIEEVGTNIKRYTIELPGPISPAVCYSIRLGRAAGGISRPYSPVSAVGASLVCVIKLYAAEPGREMLTPLLAECGVGSRLRVTRYLEKFPVMEILSGKHERVYLISGGTGVAPMMQVLDYAEKQRVSGHQYHSIAFNRCRSSIILKDRAEYPRLDLTVSDIITDDAEDHQHRALKRLEGMLQETLSRRGQTAYLVCGPDSLVEAVAGPRQGHFGGLLQSLGIDATRCYKF